MTGTMIHDFRRTVRQCERLFAKQLESETVCCGVTLAQCHALLEIEEALSISLTRLAKALGLEKSTVSRTIDGLVEAGLVARAADSHDRRAQKLSLTEKSRTVLARINKECDNYYRAVFLRLPATRREGIIDGFCAFVKELVAVYEETDTACCFGTAKKEKKA
jgi:DNA-binding MarR family transcriptional regulator